MIAVLAACSGGGGGGGTVSMPTATAGSSSTASALTESPMAARVFVDTMGVNVDTVNNLPAANVAPVAMLLKQMGLRHIRAPIITSSSYASTVSTFLQESGTKALGLTNCPEPLGPTSTSAVTSADITTFQSDVGGQLDGVEAVNEPDSRASADPNWASDTRSCMQAQTGAIPSLPYLAPAISYQETDAPILGNVASLVTAGNIHHYFSGHSPDNPGYGAVYGCGVANSLVWAMCEAQINSGPQPLYITETGYNSDSEVDLPTQAKYLSRVYFINANAGIVRTYVYVLVGYSGGDGFGGDGLIDQSTLAPKPAYYAIQSLTAAIDDSSLISPITSPVTYSIAGPSSLQHLLIRKRSGLYILALWNETPSWDPSTDTEIAVPAQTVKVTLPHSATNVSAEALNDSGAFASSTVTANANSLSLPVDDHITLLMFDQP
jgi:hypothetical protein